MQSCFLGLRAVEKETAAVGRPRKYSDELRRRAIDEVLDRDRKIPEVARQLGIGSAETLRNWVRQANAIAG